jgi:hypothetical protein
MRNTLLAITACHLRHISPGILQHRIAEHFYQSLAIQDFQTALETPSKSLGQQGVNALLLAALLLNMIAFTLPHQDNGVEDDPKSSWVFSFREDRLGWLAGGSQTSLDLTVSVFGQDGSLSRSHHVWPQKGRLERNPKISNLEYCSWELDQSIQIEEWKVQLWIQ